MYIVEDIITKRSAIRDVVCNKCAKSLRRGDDCFSSYLYGLPGITYEGGYFSSGKIIQDGQKIQFSICESCLDDLIQTFKIPATCPHSFIVQDSGVSIIAPNYVLGSEGQLVEVKPDYEGVVTELSLTTLDYTVSRVGDEPEADVRAAMLAINKAQTIDELAIHLTDESSQVRSYATAKIEQLQKNP
jgi:hypothetical protein